MSNEIKLTQSLDDRQYIEALQKQYQLMERMEKRLDGVAKAAKKAGNDGKKAMDDCSKSIEDAVEATVGWAAGLLSISSGFNLVTSANKAAREEAEKTGREYDALIRKVAVLGNMSSLQTKEAQATLMETAKEVGWTKEQATSAAVALMGAGFSTEEAIGPSAVALGKVMAASGEIDADPGEIATATANYNKAIGKPMNAESILEMGKRAVGLDATNFTLNNIPDVAKIAAGLNRINPEEQFAIQAALQDVYPTGAEASTAFKSIYGSLTSKGNRKEWQEAVGRLGLKADDIDFLGEDAATVLDRINTAYEAAPQKTRDNEMNSIFGEFGPAVVNLMQNAGKVRKNIALQKDTSAFDNKIAIATSGRNAGERRMDVELEGLRLQNDQQDDLFAKQREILFLKQGEPAAHNAINAAGYSAMRSLGVSQRTAHGMFSPMNISFDDVTKAMNANTRAVDKNTELMQRQSGGAPSSPVMQQGRKQ